MMTKDIKEILVTKEAIEKRTCELAKEISYDYAGKKPLLIGLLKGSIPFMAELMKSINIYAQTEYMAVSSYGNGTTSSGVVTITKDIDISLEGRDIIIVEDIIDTGRTLADVVKVLKGRGANSVEIVCLLNKPSRRVVEMDVKYIGFEVEDKFVVGFGLDYAELYRNLPYIGVLKEEVYKGGN